MSHVVTHGAGPEHADVHHTHAHDTQNHKKVHMTFRTKPVYMYARVNVQLSISLQLCVRMDLFFEIVNIKFVMSSRFMLHSLWSGIAASN